MLLTSSQVSFFLSTAIILLFTLALFLAGYVLQQQTVRNLSAEIKPRMHARTAGYSALHGLSLPSQFATTAPAATDIPLPEPLFEGAVVDAVDVEAGRDSGLGIDEKNGRSTDQDEESGERREIQEQQQQQQQQQQVVAPTGGGWKSRMRAEDNEYLVKGQERFEAEGDDFFAPKPRVVGQVGMAGRRR